MNTNRIITTAQAHLAAGNLDSAARMMSAAIRASATRHQYRTLRAAADAMRLMNHRHFII